MIHVDPNPQDAADLDTLAARLEATGAYRVLRKLGPRPAIEPPAGVKVRQGLFVDTETTGLDPARDEIIELAMVPFTYGLDGEVYAVGEPFQQLREPSKPIPAAITAITGIDDAMVAGKRIDPNDVTHAAAPASLVVAHNAAFDRRFLERFCETFNTKPWACSMSEIDWAAEGYEGTKLAYLAGGAGFFYERHRATHDCMAAIELLARVHPKSGRTGLAQLLERARTPSFRIWAENSPFDLKDILKARGYRWNGEGPGRPGPGTSTSVTSTGSLSSRSSRPKSIGERSSSWFDGSTPMTGFRIAAEAGLPTRPELCSAENAHLPRAGDKSWP